jgi:hypothetical protein
MQCTPFIGRKGRVLQALVKIHDAAIQKKAALPPPQQEVSRDNELGTASATEQTTSGGE